MPKPISSLDNVPNRHQPILDAAVNSLSSNEQTNLPDYSLSWGEFSENDLVQLALDNGFRTDEILEQAALRHTSAEQNNNLNSDINTIYRQELFHHAVSFIDLIRQGKVHVIKSALDDPDTVLEEFQITDDMVVPEVLPSVNADGTVDQGRHKSSFLPSMISHLISNASHLLMTGSWCTIQRGSVTEIKVPTGQFC